MAAEVEPVSTKRLEGTLVAPRVRKSVPNHLTDTKVFSKVKKNGVLQTYPTVIHFDGYRVGEAHQQTLRIINASRDNQQMHIVPPTTPFFSIKYSKQRSSLVPGLSLQIIVQFRPTEWQYYYDCIRIHCKGEQNLLIPIHAYPVMNTATFPTSVSFPPTSIGQSQTKTISLGCDVPIDFEFRLSYLQPHHTFSVTPMKGIVPANGRVDVAVTFTPTEFSTAIMRLQVELSQFNSSPLVCTFTGNSSPGLAVEQLRRRTSDSCLQHRPTKARPLPPVERNRLRTRGGDLHGQRISSTGTLPSRVEEETLYNGILFPANLETPSAVAKVLGQQPGRLKASQLKRVSSLVEGGLGSRQVKEASFLQQVRQAAEEERANKLRWVTSLGSLAMTMEEKEAVLQARTAAHKAYQRHCHLAVPGEGFSRFTTECTLRRTRRRVGECPDHTPKFDPYTNDDWRRRHLSLQRFVQAGRRVMLRLRCQRRLDRLRRDVMAGGTPTQSIAKLSEDRHEVVSLAAKLLKSADSILPFSFPKFVNQENKGATLGQVEVKPTEVEVKKDVSYLDLKVPQQYKLLGYSPHPTPLEGSYIAPGLPRPLRTGAEDELQSLGCIPGVDPTFLTPSAFLTTTTTTTTRELPGAAEEESPEAQELVLQDVEEDGREDESLPLVPPPALFNPPQRHSLEVFRPAPGVNHYVPMLPHSEVTLDHFLLPLPLYPSAKHPQVKLHPQDVIPGVMRWKQFPCQGLVALEGGKRLSETWRPTWNDQFSEDLLPHMEPCLLSGPEPDDLVDQDSMEVVPVPTLEMVQAQFHTPSTSAQQEATRAHAMSTLEEEKSRQFNQLGQRIHQRLQTMLSHLDDSKLKVIEEEGGV